VARAPGAAVAFGVEHGGRGDADGRLAAAHLAIDDRGAFAAVDQQLGDGMDHLGLRLEQLALEAGEDELPMRLRLAGVDRRIGAVERVQQLVAELGDEVLLKLSVRGEAAASSRSPCTAVSGTVSRSRDMVMLQREGACTSPCGAMACPGWEERNGARPSMRISIRWAAAAWRLRSHSVMIQSFRSGVTW
jgi:hypothetical protein